MYIYIYSYIYITLYIYMMLMFCLNKQFHGESPTNSQGVTFMGPGGWAKPRQSERGPSG